MMIEEYIVQRILSGNLEVVVVQLSGGIDCTKEISVDRYVSMYPNFDQIRKELAPNVSFDRSLQSLG
jgi:hypothetical protein